MCAWVGDGHVGEVGSEGGGCDAGAGANVVRVCEGVVVGAVVREDERPEGGGVDGTVLSVGGPGEGGGGEAVGCHFMRRGWECVY